MIQTHRECQWSLRSTLPMLMNQRVGHHHHASDVNAVIHWYGRRCSSSTDTRDVRHSYCCWSRKRNTNSLFNHTSLFLCYRHLNNRSTGIKVYSLGSILTLVLKHLSSARRWQQPVKKCICHWIFNSGDSNRETSLYEVRHWLLHWIFVFWDIYIYIYIYIYKRLKQWTFYQNH